VVFRIPSVATSDDEKTDRGTLILINPSNPDKSVIEQLKKLETDTNSEVRYLVSPCDWHYMFIGHYLPHFPKAKAYVPPGRIPLQKPKYEYTLINMDDPFPQFAPHLHVLSFRGLSDKPSRVPYNIRQELVFFHPSSKMITAGDCLYFNTEHNITTVLARERKAVLSFHYKNWKVVANAEQCLETIKEILEWDFDRYISVHGGLGNMQVKGAKADLTKLIDVFSKPPRSYKAGQPKESVAAAAVVNDAS